MSVFFTSDHHLGHRAMAYLRKHGEWPKDKSLGTPDMVAWHDAMLADAWDSVVTDDDTVWVLGDLTTNTRCVPDALAWVQDRPGTKHFVPGNHDPVHPMHRDSHLWQRKYLGAFASVQMAATRVVKVDGESIKLVLSHFPFTADGAPHARFTEWRLREEGDYYLLHGHTHDTGDPFSGREIHVGVDAWSFKPVKMEVITAYILGHRHADSMVRVLER